ncbi:hypothetical protein I4U23_017826 [Adineta vaga]|nr:hypothetical protein I4U23_017826 [Adineta vaga]
MNNCGNDEYRIDIVVDEEVPFNENLDLADVADLAEMCELLYGTKYLKTLIYNIGLMVIATSHKWATIFIKDDYEEFLNDLRDGKQTDSFYDTFP